MRVSAVFLDVDGVINDHALNPGMWDSLMGDVLAPALGGEPADWGRANRKVFPRIWAQQHTWGTDPMERITIEARLILSGMCEELGLRPPAPGVVPGALRGPRRRHAHRGVALCDRGR